MLYYIDFTQQAFEFYRFKSGTVYQFKTPDRDDITNAKINEGDWVHLNKHVVLRKLNQFG